MPLYDFLYSVIILWRLLGAISMSSAPGRFCLHPSRPREHRDTLTHLKSRHIECIVGYKNRTDLGGLKHTLICVAFKMNKILIWLYNYIRKAEGMVTFFKNGYIWLNCYNRQSEENLNTLNIWSSVLSKGHFTRESIRITLHPWAMITG